MLTLLLGLETLVLPTPQWRDCKAWEIFESGFGGVLKKNSGCLGMGDDQVTAHSDVTNSESGELWCFFLRKQNPEGEGTGMEECSSLSFSQVGYNPTEWLLDDDQAHLSGRNKPKGYLKNGIQIKGYLWWVMIILPFLLMWVKDEETD